RLKGNSEFFVFQAKTFQFFLIFNELFVNRNGQSAARCKTVQISVTTAVVLQQLHLVHGPLKLLCSMLFC
ncbi:MAG: hypothetical protein ACKPKO_37880, partial [Candidatus Fonsibacter sp.]